MLVEALSSDVLFLKVSGSLVNQGGEKDGLSIVFFWIS
jgi:hypothetical protein